MRKWLSIAVVMAAAIGLTTHSAQAGHGDWGRDRRGPAFHAPHHARHQVRGPSYGVRYPRHRRVPVYHPPVYYPPVYVRHHLHHPRPCLYGPVIPQHGIGIRAGGVGLQIRF